jgi:outer membrane murein-binding lipoprotein Lpp
MKRLALILGICLCAGALCAADPGAREDARLERQKVLKAADTLDELTAQIEQLRARQDALTKAVNDLTGEVESLRGENDQIRAKLAAAEASRAKEREALIGEVSSLVGGAKGRVAAPEPSAPAPKPAVEKGYEHVVQPGETIYGIARFYREQGVAVTSTNICEANGIDRKVPLKAGQKLFIPKRTP